MIIGFSGKINSGKNTAANLFAKHASLISKKSVVHKYFAFKLKQIVEILTGLRMKQSFVDNYFSNGITDFTTEDKNIYINEFKMTIGQMLQILGTDVFREHFDKSIWIKSLFLDYDEFEKRNSIWVISDCRFTNEAVTIKKHNGILIRINRPQIDINSSRNLEHLSETSLDNFSGFDYVIENDKDLETLENTIKEITQKILNVADSST